MNTANTNGSPHAEGCPCVSCLEYEAIEQRWAERNPEPETYSERATRWAVEQANGVCS